MILKPPFLISSRLLPAIAIGRGADKCTISLAFDRETSDHRAQFRYYLDFQDGREYSANDIRSGVGGAGMQEMFSSLLSFMSAAGESINHCVRSRREPDQDDNASLFPRWVSEWCAQYSDELSMLDLEIEETPELIAD